MKKKELINLAQKIAALEKKLEKTENKKEKNKIQNAIIQLSNKITSMEDIFALDELIQQFLNK